MRLSKIVFLTAFLAGFAAAEEARFSVVTDRDRIGEDESVSVRFQVVSDGSVRSIGEPQFSAPDFETLNSFQSSSVEGTYENGRFGMRSTQQVNVVLRPKKKGTLKISGLAVEVDGKKLTAPDLTVVVDAGGAGTAPPRGYGGHGGLRGAARRPDTRAFFVRAEVSKDRAYKGEQVIVSYYLFRSTRIYTVVPKQFPILPGFLKEDLEMPILGNRYDWERVTLDGAAYERALLARFAAYPLKEGKLVADPFTVEVSYATARQRQAGFDEDDPFSMLFQQVAPRTGQQKSDPVTIEAIPLPEAGKPADFTGGVGDFEVSSAVDRTETRAGEPVSLTIQVEGRGNVAAIELPKIEWPEGVDLFDAKGRVKPGQGGIGSKSFEFLLIPRKEGEIRLPAIALSFFDPGRRAYVSKRVEGAVIRVSPGDPSKMAEAKIGRAGGVQGKEKPDSPELPDASLVVEKLRERAPLIGGGVGILAGLFLLVASVRAFRRSWAKTKEAKRARPKPIDFRRLRAKAASLPDSASRAEIEALAEEVADEVARALEEKLGISVRAEPRENWARILEKSHAVPSELWPAIRSPLDFADLLRYGGGTEAPPDWRIEMGRNFEGLRALEGFLKGEKWSS